MYAQLSWAQPLSPVQTIQLAYPDKYGFKKIKKKYLLRNLYLILSRAYSLTLSRYTWTNLYDTTIIVT